MTGIWGANFQVMSSVTVIRDIYLDQSDAYVSKDKVFKDETQQVVMRSMQIHVWSFAFSH